MNDKQPNHCYRAPTCSFVGIPLVLVLGKYDGDDEVAERHSNCADEEDGFSAEGVDVHDCWDLQRPNFSKIEN